MRSYPPPNATGTIYLLHYSAKTSAGRQHYLGFTGNLERRYARHQAGIGCDETSKAVAEGLKLTVAQTWKGTPTLEKRIKEWHRERTMSFAHICPLCGGEDVLPTELARELGLPTMRVRMQSPRP